MRSFIPLFTLLWTVSPATIAQDTTSITFTEETASITEQRFIDRHESFFMTKVPTRKMFKLGYIASTYNGIGLNLAFKHSAFRDIETSVEEMYSGVFESRFNFTWF
jgi:hypothetical protein